MAIKDQCANCTKYDTYGQCSHYGGIPSFDSRSCDSYYRCGGNIDLTKHTDTVSAPAPAPTPTQPQPVAPTVSPSGRGGVGTKKMFQHPFSFSGRIRRLEYGLSYLIYLIYYFPMNALEEDQIGAGFAAIWLILLIPMMWFLYAQGAKRCHDLGHNGWWQIIPFYFLWMLFEEGDYCSNEYGDNPKA